MPQLPAAFVGFDKSGLPTGGGTASDGPVRRLSVARWLFTHTNWRVAGGYPSISSTMQRPAGLEHAIPYVAALVDENRGWSTIFEDLWTHGWGIGIFAVVLSRVSLYHQVKTPPNSRPLPPAPDNVARTSGSARPVALRPYATTPGAWDGGDFDTADLPAQSYIDAGQTEPTVVLNASVGTLHGHFIKWLMSVRHPGLVSPVVFIDNEDSSGTIFSSDELAYYRALFIEMATRRPGEPPLRPGIYAHGEAVGADRDNSRSVISQLLAQYPELLPCQVEYVARIGRSQLPIGAGGALSAPSSAMNRFPVTDAAALHSLAVPRGSLVGTPWTAWPIIKQWEGNNGSALPPGPTAALPFRGVTRRFSFGGANGGWDFDSSTVPDPTYPAASPRLTLGSAGSLCMLAIADRPDPIDDNTASSGRITVYRIDDRGQVTQHGQALQAPRNYVILPGARLRWAGSYLVTLARPLAALACVPIAWQLTASGMRAIGAIPVPPLPVHAPLDGSEASGTLRLFGPATTGQLKAIAGDPAHPNAFTLTDQASGHLLHPFTDIAATHRRPDVIDIIGVSETGALATTWWTPGQSGSSAWTQIGSPGALLPSTRLCLLPSGPDGLLALGVGANLQLTGAHWTAKAAKWTGPYPMGQTAGDVLVPQSSLAARAVSTTKAQILYVSSDGTLMLGTFAPGRNGNWTQSTAPIALDSPTASGNIGENTVYDRAPHPMSDLGLGRAGLRTIAAFVRIEPGQSRVWLASRADTAGADQGKGWTPWDVLPPPR